MNDSLGETVLRFELLFAQIVGLVVLILWIAFRLKKKLASSKRSGKPFAAPGIVLRHFNSPQRAYLLQQHWWLAGYFLCLWLALVGFNCALPFGQEKLNSYGFALSLPQYLWYAYLRSGFFWSLGLSGLLAAGFARVSVQQRGIEPRFIRTRPLTRRCIFWSRTGIALASLLAAIATAAVGSFLLLVKEYGPVWNQGLSIIDFPGITEQQAHILISTLRTSPLRPFLSLLTTTALVFSLGVAIGGPLWGLKPNSTSKAAEFLRRLLFSYLLTGIFGLAFFAFRGRLSFRIVGILFQYNTVGPPPSYAWALIPMFISAALLKLAQCLDGRREAR